MNDVTRRQLETRRDAFADAAREFPCVRHCWKCWPENEPQPPIPEKYHPKNAIPIEQRTDGTLVWDVLPCQVGDGPGERIIEGMASLWWELRMYGEYPRRRDVTEPAREQACIDRLDSLANAAGAILLEVDTGIPARIMARRERYRWRLAVLCLLGKVPAAGEIAVLDDVFLAGAMAIDKLLADIAPNDPMQFPIAVTVHGSRS